MVEVAVVLVLDDAPEAFSTTHRSQAEYVARGTRECKGLTN
jgi:hypothetical protein